MTTAPVQFEIRAPRFSSIDFLWLSFWIALLIPCLTMNVPVFLPWIMAGGGVLIARHFYSVVWRGEPDEGNLLISVAMPVFCLLSGFALAWVNRMTPVLYDRQLAQWDFGVAPAIRTWALARWWAIDPINLVYRGLPLAMLLVLVVTTGLPRRRLLYAMALAGVLAVPCYLLCPAVGPAHLTDPSAPRNCMPSMHLTWTLLLWVNASGRVKWLAGGFAAFTALATLATGEHYLPDLVAALPWTWLISIAVNRLAPDKAPR